MADTELAERASGEGVGLEFTSSWLVRESEGLWIRIGSGFEHLFDQLSSIIGSLKVEAKVAVFGPHSHDHGCNSREAEGV